MAEDSKKPRFAFWLETDNQKACEVARLAGYEVVVFDMEHGILDDWTLDRLVPFCWMLGLEPLVRVAEATQSRIQTPLDVGAAGVILPQIRDLAHAEAVTRFVKFPPLGARGLGYSRTTDYRGADNGYIARENATRRCWVMVETAGALHQAAAMARLPCVDGLFAGPSDLSLARGRGIFSSSEADLDDLRSIAGAAVDAGKLWACAAGNRGYRTEALRHAPAFVTVADDLSALQTGFAALLE